MSIESSILDYLENILIGIRIAGGYLTDAGENVFVNLEYETAPDANLFPCIIIFPGELTSGNEGDVPPCMGEQNNFLPVHIEAYILDDERGSKGRQVKEDLRKAITATESFGGLVEQVQEYKSASEVRPGAESFFSYIDVDFIIFFVTPWGEI